MTAPTTLSNRVGILSAVGASLFFSFNDMAIKFLSGGYALHQIVLIRSLIGLVVLLVLIIPFVGGYGSLKTRRLKTHILRGLCVVFANMTFFLSLATMPLADAVAIFFVAPLVITVMSVIFLNEKVGPRRWAAVGVGLLGVVIMIRPGSGSFQLVALLPLAAAVGYSLLHILTRKMSDTESAGSMTFYVQVTFLVTSASIGLSVGDGHLAASAPAALDFLLREWVIPAPKDAIIFAAIGAASTFGAYLITQAYRLCEAGLAAPFEYVAMPVAIFWGYVVFDEVPDLVSWIGISFIVGSGLYAFWRETVLDRPVTGHRPTRR